MNPTLYYRYANEINKFKFINNNYIYCPIPVIKLNKSKRV